MIKHEAQGFWLEQTAMKSSNYREIKAVAMAMLAFLPLKKTRAHIFSATFPYLNFQGGPSQELTDILYKFERLFQNTTWI